jgi:hypothetical protein
MSIFKKRKKITEVRSRSHECRPFAGSGSITPAYRSGFYFFTKTTVKFAQDVDYLKYIHIG